MACIVLGLKWWAYDLTGSVALYSDALESVINIVTALTTLVAVRFAALPADSGHPYGHTKVEYLSAVLVGVFIVIAALGILLAAVPNLLNPKALSWDFIGLSINVLAGIINGIWALYLLRVGRKARSPALNADAKHILSDVLTSVGVVFGVALASLTGWALLDPLLALLVALHVLYSGWQVLRESVGGLMDASIPHETEQLLRHILSEHAVGALEIHDLRTRTSGKVTFAEFHLVVPGHMTVHEAHAICDRLEDAIHDKVEPHMHVTIHIEPQDEAKQSGVLVL